MAVNNIQELDTKLRGAFAAIKKDISSIKRQVTKANNKNDSFSEEFSLFKNESASVDKLNILKIRLGDFETKMNAWNKTMDKIEQKYVDVKSFDKEFKKLEKKQESVKEDVKSLKHIEKDAKTKKELEAQIGELGKRITSLKYSVTSMKNVKERILKKYLEKFRNEFTKKNLLTKKMIRDVSHEQKKYVTEVQINDMLGQVNQEFDSVKKDIKRFPELKKRLKKLEGSIVDEKYFSQQMDEIYENMDDLKEKMNDLDYKLNSDYIDYKNFNSLKKKLRKENATVKAMVTGQNNRFMLKKDFQGLMRRARSKKEPEEAKEIRQGIDQVAKKKKKKPVLMPIGNIFIIIAFILIIASIVFYFLEFTKYMDYSLYSAFGFLIVGLILRYLGIRRSKKQNI